VQSAIIVKSFVLFPGMEFVINAMIIGTGVGVEMKCTGRVMEQKALKKNIKASVKMIV